MDVHTCRDTEDLTPGAHWCRRCYRYKLRGCDPTEKKVERFGKETPRSKSEKWIVKGDPKVSLARKT